MTAKQSPTGLDRVFGITAGSCRRIEPYVAEVINKNFGSDLAAGGMEWRPVEIQREENRHFTKYYNRFTRSLVLVRVRNGLQNNYAVPEKAWELLEDRPACEACVRDGVDGYLGELR